MQTFDDDQSRLVSADFGAGTLHQFIAPVFNSFDCGLELLGFIFQQLRMLSKKAGAADRKVAEVETKKSAREVYRTSARAKIERVIWFILLIVVAVGAAILLVYLS